MEVARLSAKLIGLALALALLSEAGWSQKSVPLAPSKKLPTKTTPKKPTLTAEDQRREIIFSLLEEAHAAAKELPTEQRVPILKEICGLGFAYTARFPNGLTPTRGTISVRLWPLDRERRKWLRSLAEELYRAADELPQGSNAKLDAQVAAARAMVPVDDKRALEILDKLEAADPQRAEQQRNYLATDVFAGMLQRHGESVIPDLRARAQTMGENGQYPYGAMAAVLSQVQNRELVQAIFEDALASYQHASDRLVSMFEMLSMVRDEHIRQKLEPSQVREAAQEIANQLKREIDREQRAFDEGKPGRPGLLVLVEGIRGGLKEVDPDVAASIPSVPAANAAPARQLVGDGAPAPPVTNPDMKKLRPAFEKTSTRLIEMSESEIHGGTELRQVIEKGVDQGTELLHASIQDANDHTAALDYAIGPVADFVQLGARLNAAMTLECVRKIQDSEIRARMLLAITGALPDPRYGR